MTKQLQVSLMSKTFPLALLVFVLFLLMDKHHVSAKEKVEKRGAGFFIACEGKVLLLRRNSKHHNDKWALPGGNVEPNDGDLLNTAVREANEEMGHLPPYTVLGEILTKRGKKKHKHFTVFIASITKESMTDFKPQLNKEHSAWQWASISYLQSRDDLHPIIRALIEEHYSRVSKFLS